MFQEYEMKTLKRGTGQHTGGSFVRRLQFENFEELERAERGEQAALTPDLDHAVAELMYRELKAADPERSQLNSTEVEQS